jgi:uncharacterized protein
MMNFSKAVYTSLLTLTIISFPAASLAIPVEQVPNPRQINGGWVTDMADVLNPATEAELNQIISDLEAKNGSEIAVVTVTETAPSPTPKQFATTLFNRWGIGKKEQNNGVLVLISTSDRRIEIETGYGLQTILPNAKVTDIIQQEMTPRFKQGDYNGGTIAGTKALISTLENHNQTTNDGQFPWYTWLGVIGGGTVALWAIFRRPKNSQKTSNQKPNTATTKSSSPYKRSSTSSYSSGSSSSNNSSTYDSRSSYGSSSDSGSSSSSSSDFGGGSSGGDGGGGSW